MGSLRRRGFTFIETIIAIAVLAAVSAFIVPTYQLILSQLQLSSTVQTVSEIIRTAQQKTVTEQQSYGLTFTAGSDTIPLYLYNANGTKTQKSTIEIPTNISLSTVSFSGNSDVRFTSSGAPTVAGYIVLTDTVRGRSRKVEIRPSGGIINNTAEY